MIEDKGKMTKGRGIGMIPFFIDESVDDSLRLMARKIHMKPSTLVIKIVSDKYRDIMKEELNTSDVKIYRDSLKEASKKARTSNYADFQEWAVSKWLEKEVTNMLPKIKRGG